MLKVDRKMGELMYLAFCFTERKHSVAYSIFGRASRGGKGLGYKWSQCQCPIPGKPTALLPRNVVIMVPKQCSGSGACLVYVSSKNIILKSYIP